MTPGMVEDLEARRMLSVGGTYTPPLPVAMTVNVNAAWKFRLNPTGAPQAFNYDDSSWSAVTLPYTWNGTDAATTSPSGSNGWYRRILNIDSSMAGKKLYLQFGAGAIVTTLYIDGTQIDLNPATPELDSHKGGFQSFLFDVTAALNGPVPAGKTGHVIAVKTNSANNADIAPANGGDYSRQGGLYRDVSLLAVNPSHIALTQTVAHPGVMNDVPSPIAGNGILFSHSPVVMGAASTDITITTVLDNLQSSRAVDVTSYLVDAGGVIRAEVTSTAALNSGESGISLSQSATLSSPHLWNGRIDPYLYTLYVEVRDKASRQLLDLGQEQVGIRSFRINANPNVNGADPMNRAPFMLNGQPYRVVGVNAHQDTGRLNASGNPAGWAQTASQIRADIDLMAAMGVTAIRTSHYQQNPAFYDYCDQLGILVYTESAINGSVTNTPAYLLNAQDQYQELIRQNYNNASIFAWGFGNETSQNATLVNVFTQLNAIAHGLDSSRFTAFGQYGGSNSSATNADGIPDIKGTHPYDYWYGPSDVKSTHAAYPSQPLGVTEYGGGASAYQYADSFTLPVGKQTGGVTTHFHPANQQTRLEELQYTDLSQLNFLWGMFTWQMFDHGSAGKNEGDQGGVNDKGLVTRDRVTKDSYYFYQASLNDPSRTWNNQRVLSISDRFWTARNSPTTTVTVFSNVGVPTLTLNGMSLGAMTPLTAPGGPNAAVPGVVATIANTYTMDIALALGVNSVQVDGSYSDGQKYRDTATWTYRNAISGTNYARIDFVGSGQTAASGYVADSGGNYGVKGTRTYGWLAASGSVTAFGSTLAVGSTFGSGSTDATQNGINLRYDPVYKNSSVWEYALPNGTYDVRIGAGQAATSDSINMFALEGKTAAIDSNGNNTQDTFYARVTVVDGKLTLSAIAGAYNTRITYLDINQVTGDSTPAVVSKVIINGGQAQRSVIDTISVVFNRPVSLAADALSLSLRGGAKFPLVTSNPSSDGMTYTVALKNGTSLRQLADGVYSLGVDNTKVSGATMAAPFTFTFHRLFGDISGNRRVASDAVVLFAIAKGSTSNSFSYTPAFDFDGDGDIDAVDALRFKQRQNQSFSY